MTINEVPIGDYTDITDIILAPPQAKIVIEFDKLMAFIPDPEASDAETAGVSGAAPDYDNVPPAYAVHIRAEIAALRAAIAAAPLT